MVPSWHVQRGINSFFVQFCCRDILDCRGVGRGPLGTLDLVSISAGKTQGMVPGADLFADRRSSGDQAEDANITGMTIESNG